VLVGPVTITFLARFLSPAEQGFYYTFGSILALQIFFELGLSYVILQFASHERAKLHWTEQGTLEGDPVAKAKLASLLRRALIWYSCMALLIVATLLPLGLFFFSRDQHSSTTVVWQLPWVWVIIASAVSLLMSPIFAVLEGCGLVVEIALLRIYQSVIGSFLLWMALFQHWKLFATPVLTTAGLLWGAGWLILRKARFLRDLLTFRHGAVTIDWRREIWSFQWKIALSAISSYFIFLFFNPVLFTFHGAVVAGQMGMSLSIVSAFSTMGMAWVNTKIAPFGTLIAQREFRKLDQLFFPALWQSFAVVALGGAIFWFATFYLHHSGHSLGQRVIPPFPLGLLVLTAVLNHIVVAEAIYLRSHKQEPFLVISVVIGCLVALSTYFLGKRFGVNGMMAGYFVINLVLGLGVGTWIFIRKRRLWHSEAFEHKSVNAVA